MKKLLFVFVVLSVCSASAGIVKPELIIDRAVVINGSADSASLDTAPSIMSIGRTGCDLVTSIGTAMSWEFKVSGVAVNVTNLNITKSRYSLYHNGIAVASWFNQNNGAYNIPGDSAKPDMVAYDKNGTRVSTNGVQVIGSTLATVSKFQYLDQVIGLGTSSRPRMGAVGNSYRFVREIDFTYWYGGFQFSEAITEDESAVLVKVVPDLPTHNTDGGGPFRVILEISDDLVTWIPQEEVEVPNPIPTDPAVIIALVPKPVWVTGTTTDLKRFYRFREYWIFSPPS